MTEPWLREDNPYNVTATGFLGKKRPEMLSNPLLRRPRMGVANYPVDHKFHPSKVFGSCYRDPWAVAHAVRGWAGTLPPVSQRLDKPKVKKQKDFLQLNMAAMTAGAKTSSDVRLYRKVKRPIKLRLGSLKDKKLERPIPKVFKPTDIFGMPTPFFNVMDEFHVGTQASRYQTDKWIHASMLDLLSHAFQKQYIRAAKHEEIEIRKKQKVDYTKIRPNRASSLRPHIVHTGVLSLPWRHSKFLSEARPHLSTFRSCRSLSDAWIAHSFERSGRDGETGQGIAKNTPHEHPLPALRDPEKCRT